MKILKSVGAFFVAIWRWIKNTAWVQPLLIVGVIFGVIFSIPAITKGIQGLVDNSNSSQKYLEGYQKSLEGGESSDADKLFINYKKYEDYDEEQRKTIPNNEKKFFLYFCKSSDADLTNVKTAFETLKDNWGKNKLYVPNDGLDFNLYTIFTDEDTNESKPNNSAFAQFLTRRTSFFENVSDVGQKSNYFINGKITKEQCEKLESGEESDFTTPTIILVDWVKSNDTDEYCEGISQVMFSVPGDNENLRASLLLDCWNGKGDFEPAK